MFTACLWSETFLNGFTPAKVKQRREDSSKSAALNKTGHQICMFFHFSTLYLWFFLFVQAQNRVRKNEKNMILPPQYKGMYFSPTRNCVKNTTWSFPIRRASFSVFLLFLHQARVQWNKRNTKLCSHSPKAWTWPKHDSDICLKQTKQVTNWVTNIYSQILSVFAAIC